MKVMHKLKIQPEFFKAWVENRKTFEIRNNDRNFKLGDTVRLCEYKDGSFTNDYIEGTIQYITDYKQIDGYVVFSLGLHSYEVGGL